MKARILPPALKLTGRAAHVWRMDCRLWDPAQLADSLSTAELERARRFHREQDRNRYLVTHGLMRRILGAYLECPPDRIEYETDAGGKPRLAGESSLRFNLSASGGMGLLAVTMNRSIGVDVEFIDPAFDWAAVAGRYFTHAERLYMAGLSAAERRAGFYRLWAAKEACLKCSGEGLRTSPDQVDANLDSGLARKQAKSWRVHPLRHFSQYAACLSVMEPIDPVMCWEWNPDFGPQQIQAPQPGVLE